MPASGSVSYSVNTGDYFYDSGGPGYDYTNNENGTITFHSSVSGMCIQFSFFLFNVQEGNDYLYVYDGPDATYPLIGTYTRIGSPGTFSSSLGSITFRFTSNSSQTRIGWGATISLVPSMPVYDIKNSHTQTISTCGAIFYDSGLSSGNYAANELYWVTFSSSSGNCIQALLYAPAGTSIPSSAINTGDTLRVYDGPSTASPLIAAYYSGSKTPTRWLSSSGSLTFRFRSNASNHGSGWTIILSCTSCPSTPGGTTYLQPAGANGYQNTACGAPMVNTCSGTITDNGGTLANYSSGIGTNWSYGLYRTFCPAQQLTCLRLQFYEIKINGATHAGKNDVLRILNGPTQYNIPLPNGNNIKGVNCNSYVQCMGQGFGPYVSTDPSGCITVVFQSNNDNLTDAGWIGTLDCVPCPFGPVSSANTDCINAVPICSNSTVTDASVGPGLISEGDPINSCVVAENYTSWYRITILTGGTIGFTIAPFKTGITGDDYDFALFGPNSSCSALGPPIRCSYAWTNIGGANPNNLTGMNSANNAATNTNICGYNNSGSDISEDVCGNSWVDELNVNAGEVYYLMINKWTSGGDGFTLSWHLSNGASLNCMLLPVELLHFSCEAAGNKNLLTWKTASELNNDFFIVERSANLEVFEEIARIPGKTTSLLPSEYFLLDPAPFPGFTYYRLSQVDLNGHKQFLQLSSCYNEVPSLHQPALLCDLTGRPLFSDLLTKEQWQHRLQLLPIPAGCYLLIAQSPLRPRLVDRLVKF
ncbi:MAG: CUB domain-containing protein [Chitinophagales bacterium]|nr:CUB domain-containing protein [Chitinophagales bacterium]MDW8427435.1 CUB domain-containing protein [Chitinophagales bacterium]